MIALLESMSMARLNYASPTNQSIVIHSASLSMTRKMDPSSDLLLINSSSIVKAIRTNTEAYQLLLTTGLEKMKIDPAKFIRKK